MSSTSSVTHAAGHEFPRAPRAAAADSRPRPDDQSAAGIVADRWPLLARAMGQYARGVAESFSRQAYHRVEDGLIRFEHRRQLAAEAERLGIRPFDAQLLIACAVRKWALDREFDPRPSKDAPVLSAEHRAWGTMWWRIGLAAALIVGLEGVMIWKWLGA